MEERKYMTIKLLLGGSPCTYWSIAKSDKRETKAEGQGWELFKNYLIAKEKFKPDYFLYENNWSASKAIKEQIQEELGYPLMRIDSALVSAQKRDRFYVFNGKVEQPKDRGILLKDILESNSNHEDLTSRNKSFCLTARYAGATPDNTIKRRQKTMIAVPVRVGTMPKLNGELTNSQANRVYSNEGKSVSIKANGGGWGANTGLYAQEVRGVGYRNRRDEDGKLVRRFEGGSKEKSNCLTTVQTDSMVAESPVLDKSKSIYTVKDGYIYIKDKKYPIKLKDGDYTIRKLTPVECERLQTMPDNYTACVSNTQRYKGLGNGWTAEVIIHILNSLLKDVDRSEKIIVLSMYDGIGTGRYCLDKMGFTNVEYHAFEIDKYAAKVANHNYPDIIQHGDAFQIREWLE